MTLRSLLILLLAGGLGALAAADPPRFVAKVKLPGGQTAVVAEGDFEARSTGSFSVRLYEAAEPADETTFFQAGLVRPREGTVEKVLVTHPKGDPRPQVAVVLRSVGTGGYLSIQAFTVDKGKLSFAGALEDLPPTADPLAALQKGPLKRK